MSSVILLSPIFSRSGYGDCSRSISDILVEKYESNLKYINTRWGTTPDTENHKSVHILSNTLTEVRTKYDISYQVCLPNEFKKIADTNIGITAGLEFYGWPNEFVEKSNIMDRVIVHSNFTKEAMTNSELNGGIECSVDIDVLPQSINDIYINETKVSNSTMSRLLDSIEESFCFLSLGTYTDTNDRKNIKNTIITFQDTFAQSSIDTALVLKINGANYNTSDLISIKHFIKEINSNFNNPKSIYLIYGNFLESEIKAMYTHPKVKCMISLTHGEGFGRPLLEASVCGLPIIASNWSGHIDFLDNNLCNLVNGTLSKVNNEIPYTNENSLWFIPDYQIASSIMTDFISNYNHYKKKANRLREINQKIYSTDEVKNKYHEVLLNM